MLEARRVLGLAVLVTACATGGPVPKAAPRPSAQALGEIGATTRAAENSAAPIRAKGIGGPLGVAARMPGRRVAEADTYQQALSRAYTEVRGISEGKNADYIPALAKVDSTLFGIALATVEGAVYEVGSAHDEFSIQSISKIFTLARALETIGPEGVENRVGVNATGMAFNSIIAIEMNKPKTPAMNPLVNPGAIATVDVLSASDADARWTQIIGTYDAFAGRKLRVNQEVYKSESETNTRNRAITTLLQAYEVVKGDASEILDLYTRQCSVSVNARDLAIMGATLANGGRNPLTRQQVVKPETVEQVLAVMATAGLYETTGQWMFEVRVPAKSGVGGGIVAVVPGRFAIGTFSPPLDPAGNSVRGQRAIKSIVGQLGGSVFASAPSGVAAEPTESRAPGARGAVGRSANGR